MNKYYEIMQQILPLLETIEEAIFHIQKQLKELRYEEALRLLEDSTMGIASIEKAMQPIMSQLQSNNIEFIIVNLKEKINKVISIYEQKEEVNLEKEVKEGILPVYKQWKEEIERAFKPYMVS